MPRRSSLSFIFGLTTFMFIKMLLIRKVHFIFIYLIFRYYALISIEKLYRFLIWHV